MAGGELSALEKDINAAIKLVLSEVEVAARTTPRDACHPYACEERRKRIIKVMWDLFRRWKKSQEGIE